MAQRILLLESDPAFAGELRDVLEADGAVVETVADGNEGVDRAIAFRPDAVVLAVELEGTNGFLVCKRLRKTGELDGVPIVILSSDVNAEEIFEQHQRLRTHADAYLRKPIAPERVLETLRPLVTDGYGDGSHPGEAIELEEIEVEDSGTKPPPARVVDDEIEAFAENAFGSLIMAEPEPDSAPHEDEGGANGASQVPGPFGAPHRVSDAAELASYRARAEQLEAELETFRRRAADADRLQDEVAALRGQIERGGTASTRELLDLREALNGKDKELLDLRDQLGKRDKELLEARNESLQLGRSLADHEDKILALERRLATSDDRVRSLEREKGDLEHTLSDVGQARDTAEARVAALGSDLERSRKEHERDNERMTREREEAAALLRSEHAAAIDQLRSEHEAATARASEEHARRVAELERHEVEALEAADAARRTALTDQKRELTDRHERELAELREEHDGELGVLGRKLAETETELRATHERLAEEQQTRAGLDTELQSVRSHRDGLQTSLDDTRRTLGQVEAQRENLRDQLEALRRKVSNDEAILDRARRALAIGLGLLEDQRKAQVSSSAEDYG